MASPGRCDTPMAVISASANPSHLDQRFRAYTHSKPRRCAASFCLVPGDWVAKAVASLRPYRHLGNTPEAICCEKTTAHIPAASVSAVGGSANPVRLAYSSRCATGARVPRHARQAAAGWAAISGPRKYPRCGIWPPPASQSGHRWGGVEAQLSRGGERRERTSSTTRSVRTPCGRSVVRRHFLVGDPRPQLRRVILAPGRRSTVAAKRRRSFTPAPGAPRRSSRWRIPRSSLACSPPPSRGQASLW
jgi:hypothetical protein